MTTSNSTAPPNPIPRVSTTFVMAPTYGSLREASASRVRPRRALAILPRAAAIGARVRAARRRRARRVARPRGAGAGGAGGGPRAPPRRRAAVAPHGARAHLGALDERGADERRRGRAEPRADGRAVGPGAAGDDGAAANATTASPATTPAPTTATPAPTSSPSILLYKRTHATADAEADAVFLRDNFGLNITINETAVKDEGTLGRTGGDLCAKRFGHTTLPTYSIHLFESAVTPQGPVPVADWVSYWRELHGGFVRADARGGGGAPNANYSAERASAWDAFMYNSQTFYAPDLTPFVRRLRANGVPMFPAT